jgi:DNA-binding transcriptional MerR regulator
MWYTKEFGKLTGVSVRTLHHYDKIDLLKPLARGTNGYRMYSESDLVRQQKIVALKSFGFKLTEIKKLLFTNVSLKEHLNIQVNILEEKIELLNSSIDLLKTVIDEHEYNENIDWNQIVDLIRRYNMTTDIRRKLEPVLNGKELKQHKLLEQELKENKEKSKNQNKMWESICSQVELNLNKDPDSQIGRDLTVKMKEFVAERYGDKGEYSDFQDSIWEKGFKSKDTELTNFLGFSSDMVLWIERAGTAHTLGIITNLISKGSKKSDELALEEIKMILDLYHKNDIERQSSYLKKLCDSEYCCDSTKKWINENINLLLQ